jgi:hypothetical protein
MSQLAALVTRFVGFVKAGQAEVYNEFSLQHELGLFLRQTLPGSRVQFERNIRYFFPKSIHFAKREIDIAIFSPDKTQLQHVIELKYPQNGLYAEKMYRCCEDIAFAEELRHAGFPSAAVVIFADDPVFHHGPGEGISRFIRGAEPIHGRFQKPVGAKGPEVIIAGHYNVEWKPIAGPQMYAFIEIGASE